jgi:hypothetical protein
MTRKRMVILGSLAAVFAGVAIFGYYSLIPANGNSPVFGLPSNHFIKAKYSSSGYTWVSMSSGSVKGSRTSGGGNVVDPTFVFNKGSLEAIHVINEDEQTRSMHNFNVDELGLHTRDLGYFESQTLTFVADKHGTFEYYCTIHPEMKGEITVE